MSETKFNELHLTFDPPVEEGYAKVAIATERLNRDQKLRNEQKHYSRVNLSTGEVEHRVA